MIYKLTIATKLIEGWAKTSDIFKDFDVRFRTESDLPESAVLIHAEMDYFSKTLNLYFDDDYHGAKILVAGEEFLKGAKQVNIFVSKEYRENKNEQNQRIG